MEPSETSRRMSLEMNLHTTYQDWIMKTENINQPTMGKDWISNQKIPQNSRPDGFTGDFY